MSHGIIIINVNIISITVIIIIIVIVVMFIIPVFQSSCGSEEHDEHMNPRNRSAAKAVAEA